MHRLFWIVCFVAALTAGMDAQAPQNPALAGAAPPAAPIPDTNPFSSPADIEQGGALFQTHCSYCHGSFGEGGRGADLTAGVYKRGGRDPQLYASIRNGIPGSEMAPVRITDEEVWKVVGFVKRLGSQGLLEKAPGDSTAGRLVYQKMGCASCHRIEKDGGNLGPELTEIGRRRGLKFLTESIVKPEADVEIAYRAVQVLLKSGQTVSGIRLNRDDLSIQVRDARDNLRSILMDNVQEIRYDKPSLMPAYTALNQKDLGDVIAYLNSLKGAQ
ncbi:MAG: c-type cytochrome [Vicinamibacterales bacterium]|nr:c-type cytochrome [Vicinamibacterales bacterium]